MSLPISLLADSSSNLLAARTQMGFTLGFHIVLACLGVAFPAVMLIAEWHGHRKKDPEALRLARNWSKAVAVLFAVGAVTGTVLSFEFGLLWPRFTGRFGDAFGVGFAIEGIFFFLEAIFIAIYIYGWDRLSPRAHMLAAVPIVISGIGGAFSVIAVNAWMNQPQGFDLDSAGNVTNVRPLEVLFNPATGYEFFHMFLAAYIVTGFLIASVYAVGMLRGRRDRYHRLGLVIPFTSGGDRHADPALRRGHGGSRHRRRPAGQVRRNGVHLQGRAGPDRIPRRPSASTARSRVGSGSRGSTRSWSGSARTPTSPVSTRSRRTTSRPPRRCCTSPSTSMVGIATALFLLAVWFAISWWRRRDLPATRWFLRICAVAGVAAVVALWCGWIVTEVGRQPWIVNGYMRTADAVTPAQGIWWVFGVTMALYAALAVIAIAVLRGLSRRWREGAARGAGEIPYGPPPGERSGASA